MATVIGKVYDYKKELDYGAVRRTGYTRVFMVKEMYIKETKLDTFSTLRLTEEMHTASLEQGLLTIDGITYRVTGHHEEFVNNLLTKSISLKNISHESPVSLTAEDVSMFNIKFHSDKHELDDLTAENRKLKLGLAIIGALALTFAMIPLITFVLTKIRL